MTDRDIAIVGLACRFPGAADVAGFWDLLLTGATACRPIPPDRLRELGAAERRLCDPNYVPVAGTLDHIDRFDAEYFGIAASDAASMDPQHRLFLEESVRALEDAGWAGPERRVGVYCGTFDNHYAARRAGAGRMPWDSPAALPLLVSYHLGLRGPTVLVSAQCSTSLAALHLARCGLLRGECDLALAGAVTLQLPDRYGYLAERGGIMSPKGECRPFDRDSSGSVPGSGVGVVVLKRLADAELDGDLIHAVVRGTAVHTDGADRLSFSAPSVRGMRDVVLAAHRDADVDPATVGFVEAHGTGTPLGDAVEISGLVEARELLGTHGECAVGAVKSTVGHLGEAAGMAGLIKAILAVRTGLIPPTVNHTVLNPDISLAGTGLHINTRTEGWPLAGVPRRAAISCRGLGGVDAQAIIEQHERAAGPRPPVDEPQLIAISAHTGESFAAVYRDLRELTERDPVPHPADLALTLRRRRAHAAFRQAFVVSSPAELRACLTGEPRPVAGPGDGLALSLDLGKPPGPAAMREVLARLGHVLGRGAERPPAESATVAAAHGCLRLLGLLDALGARSSSLIATAAATYVALAAAGALPAEAALRCVELHESGSRIVAGGGDLSGVDTVLADIQTTLTAARLDSPDRAIHVLGADLLIRPGGRFRPEELVELASFDFMGASGSPAPDDAPDLVSALAGWRPLLDLLRRCWEGGAELDWPRTADPAGARPLTLPPYPLAGRRYWALEPEDSAPVAGTPGRGQPADGVVTARLGEIWREMLAVPDVSPGDSFFALGGNSMLAARIVGVVLDRFGVRCAQADLLDAETLAGMAAVVDRELATQSVGAAGRSGAAAESRP